MSASFDGKRILVTGGTGSLGQTFVRRLLSGSVGTPSKIIIFSRDEAKQYQMKMHWKQLRFATDEIYYNNFTELLEYRIGDIRDSNSVLEAVRGCQIVFNMAAMKQVPTCEYFPYQSVLTNIQGAENIIRAAKDDGQVELIVGISTDKACKPINVMGMTKALQERLFIESNLRLPATRVLCVRYGNVISSRGSVIPLFKEQIRSGGPVTLTTPDMTRFLLSLEDAVDIILEASKNGRRGDIYIPRIGAARIEDIARAMTAGTGIGIKVTGIRPGEKVHETLISEEESYRSVSRGGHYVILPELPELQDGTASVRALDREYSSRDCTVQGPELDKLLGRDRFEDIARVPSH